jgi:putative restriction endonuclease
MVNAVFVHKPDSKYDDLPEKYYHFPKSYLSRVEQTVGDRIVYYGPISGLSGRFYSAVGRVLGIRSDTAHANHYYADISEYLDFEHQVEYRSNGGYESKLVSPDGSINGGTAQSAVRVISEIEFVRIVKAGLPVIDAWPKRDADQPPLVEPDHGIPGFEEEPAPFIERPIVLQLQNKKYRDARFRQNILNAYDRRCAFTGLRIINGGGRPEVEAAHIIPVEANGSDAIRNGIALSGTVHWMFDRGLLSLSDNFKILKSRHINYDVDHILNKDLIAIVPNAQSLQPHPHYLRWHRENCFKN